MGGKRGQKRTRQSFEADSQKEEEEEIITRQRKATATFKLPDLERKM